MMTLVMMTLSRLSLPSASSPHVNITARHPTPEEHVEDLLSGHVRLEAVTRVVILVETVSMTPLRPDGLLVAVEIVLALLLAVGQHGVRVTDGLEGLRCSRSAVLVRMECKREFPIALFQFTFR